MLKFFRTICKKQIEEHTVLKCILCATSKILLVMLGILITLQIVTWQEPQ